MGKKKERIKKEKCTRLNATYNGVCRTTNAEVAAAVGSRDGMMGWTMINSVLSERLNVLVRVR